MPVQFTCPHCGQLLSVARRKIGTAVQCVSCHGGVIVPAPLSETSSPLAAGTPSDSAASASTSMPERPVPFAESSGRHSPDWNAPLPVTRTAIYTIGAVIVGVAICSFLLGWSMGREMGSGQVAAATTGSNRIHGRISYATSRGKTVADSESVVIVLPTNQRPDEKLEIATLRPDVPPPNALHPTIQGIRAIGGDFARTDRTGDFQLEIPNPGEYFLLVISSHLPRSSSEPPTTKEIVELGQYFKQPDVLLGKNDFIWSKELIRSEKRFDHRFHNDGA